MILLDTNFLYALNDADDTNHDATLALFSKLKVPLFLPIPILAELCYLLQTRLGHQAMRRFLHGLSVSDIRLISLVDDDIGRVADLLDRYAESRLDFADAAIVAIAERYGISKIATFDRRDFSIIRPRHTAFFELLP